MTQRRQSPEEQLQMAVVKFLNHALDGNSFHFAVPNGGYRRLTEAMRFKAAGVVPGIPDIAVIDSGRIIFLELKSDAGRVSDVQAWCHERLRRARVPVTVCRSLEDVVAALTAAGVPLKARLAA